MAIFRGPFAFTRGNPLKTHVVILPVVVINHGLDNVARCKQASGRQLPTPLGVAAVPLPIGWSAGLAIVFKG